MQLVFCRFSQHFKSSADCAGRDGIAAKFILAGAKGELLKCGVEKRRKQLQYADAKSAATTIRTLRFGSRRWAMESIFAKPCYRRRRRCYLILSADARFARLPITEKQRISYLLHAAVLKVSANVLKSDTVTQSIYLANGE